MASAEPREIRTYMSFTFPVDPASVKTLVDLDLSYALSTTLVDWDDARKLTQGLADVVPANNEKELVLRLKKSAKWSDGSTISSRDVIKSFEHAKSLHDEAMKGLFEMVKSVEPKGESEILFKLDRPVAHSQIMDKLTEPVYGIVYINQQGKMDLTKTSGPFVLKSESHEELSLTLNHNWYAFQNGMAEKITIRQPKKNTTGDQEGFADDSWPNIMSSSSLMSQATIDNFKKEHYSIWNRNLDRLFFLFPNKKLANPEGRRFLRFLSNHLDRQKVLNGLGGYQLSKQFFPPGYVIYDPEFSGRIADAEIPKKFTERPLRLLAAEGRVGSKMQKNLIESIKALTGHDPVFVIEPLNKLFTAIDEGNYDLVVMTLAVNDPNAEGPVSFIFGLKTPIIADTENPGGNFKERITKARALPESQRNAEYRKVFTQVTEEGCIVPLFHFSSIAIARDGIDLSKIPTTDETVAFAKVRFR